MSLLLALLSSVLRPLNSLTDGVLRFSFLWSMTSIDIESTLQRVCTKVTHDNFVSADARLARKRGLIRLGEIFTQRAQEHLPKGGIEEVLSEVHCRLSALSHPSLTLFHR
jgi:hypothetical protein